MLGLLKTLPYLLLVSVVGFGAHKFIAYQLNNRIAELEQQVQEYQAHNVALESASKINEETIRSLENRLVTQTRQITTLTNNNQELQREKEEYLSIFRRHDLTRLALARPGLIEPRLNSSTKDVFEQIEQDSKEVANLDE